MERQKKNNTQFRYQIVVLLLLFVLIIARLSVQAQDVYRVVEMSGQIMSNGKQIKVGDIYRKGQKLDWPFGRHWLRVTKDGKNYKVTRDGIKKIQARSSKQPQATQVRYLSHRGWDTSTAGGTEHYSTQTYYLIGKNDFLYFERQSTEAHVLMEAVWDDNGHTMTAPIECTDDGRYYIVSSNLFKIVKRDSVRISIQETSDGYLSKEYTHGLQIVYMK